jgi:Rrf2 family iron-sulfur cluster assembly transcriptional regulator
MHWYSGRVMDVLRRNTDYALRLMINLARKTQDDSVSARTLSNEEQVSYQLACKLMQRLHRAYLVGSSMGPNGGFRLSRALSEITLLEIIEAIQGPISLNRCVAKEKACPRSQHCSVRDGLHHLQGRIDEYLGSVTLADLAANGRSRGKAKSG